MRFEHLIEINDPSIPFLPALSRRQLWQGLMWRVEDSREFLPGLDECRILQREAGAVERLLRWGEVEVLDRVTFAEEDWVCFDSRPTAHHAGGKLTITIEEPEPERLFLRFVYEIAFAVGHESEDAGYADYLRQAYEAAGIDTVQRIRELASGVRRH
ncbi:SRPBCC family protein [Denitratisoma sp. agr-D3]